MEKLKCVRLFTLGTTIMRFYRDEVEVAHVIRTSHPILPLEVHLTDVTKYKNVRDKDEAEAWIIQQIG